MIESAIYARPEFAQFWFEHEGSTILGLQGHTQMVRHFAGDRMPLSWLREAAGHVAEVMILPSDEPYQIEFYEHRRAFNDWLRHPYGERPAKSAGIIPEGDLAYFKKRGKFPPRWRPEAQRKSEWGRVSARRSWENLGTNPMPLLDLPVGLTAAEQVHHLGELGIRVDTRTVHRWRARLIQLGIVDKGHEPWHTSTTTGRDRA